MLKCLSLRTKLIKVWWSEVRGQSHCNLMTKKKKSKNHRRFCRNKRKLSSSTELDKSSRLFSPQILSKKLSTAAVETPCRLNPAAFINERKPAIIPSYDLRKIFSWCRIISEHSSHVHQIDFLSAALRASAVFTG